jgi:hypothetical protein
LANVTMPFALATEISRLEALRETSLAEMRRLIADNGRRANDKAIRKLEIERNTLQEQIMPMRMAIRPLRMARAAEVRAALNRGGACRGWPLFARVNVRTRNDCRFRECLPGRGYQGGGDIEAINVPVLGALENFARRLAGEEA